MKEWSKKNELNSFNSYKGLLYAPWYKAIKEWKDGKRKAPLPPIEASLDPIHACNLQCEHCNASRYLTADLEFRKMPKEHLMNMVKFLGEWGVKAICFGGGGEPTMHSDLSLALWETKNCGMEASIATNGTLLNDDLIDMITQTCRWVGVSIDAATPETYKIGRKADLFYKAIENLRKLASRCKETNSRCDTAFKFLIFNYNQHEIYEACKLAKELGVKDFHARPADFSHQGMGSTHIQHQNPYSVEKVLEQFEKCHELEDENFKVYTVVHKFDKNFFPVKEFDQCYASPCCIQLCADGNVYYCPDTRHKESYILGKHYPDPKKILEFWGGKKHYDLVFNSGKCNCSSRCTFTPYNTQCQKLFIEDNDPMCRWFI